MIFLIVLYSEWIQLAAKGYPEGIATKNNFIDPLFSNCYHTFPIIINGDVKSAVSNMGLFMPAITVIFL